MTEKYYQERSQAFREKYEAAKKTYNSNSLLRGITFIALLWVLIFYFRTEQPYLLAVTLGIGGVFYLLVLRHRRLQEQARYFETLSDLNEEEIKRSKLELDSFEAGDQYLKEDHPYEADLDIFGRASLFQLINRCQIDGSKDLLAKWLSAKSIREEISLRHDAVKELNQEIDWCQELSASCRNAIQQKQKHDPNVSNADLLNWVNKKTSFNKPGLWRSTAIASNLAIVVLSGLIITGMLPYQVIYIPIILNAIFLGVTFKYMKSFITGIDKSYYIISTYKMAMQQIEAKGFSSQKLQGLQARLQHDHISATTNIKRLAKLTHRLNARSNMLYIMVDVAFLLDAYLLVDLFFWKKENQNYVEDWLEIVNEMECLISLAGFSRSNPNYTFPTITEKTYYFKAIALGHPLIPKDQKVTNDYSIDGKGCVDIITGSNMSGKSTFQRTIGINMVLAQMGAPVNAKELTMGLTDIFTSMRTKDNLAENTSSFYAELKRIRQLLDRLESSEVTFFLLDEILKGTNSEDRQKGAIAIAKKLTQKPAFGLISTHDLMLGSLATDDPHIRNFSFNSEIDGNKIAFDYKISEGLCKSFNASKLMENMGIM